MILGDLNLNKIAERLKKSDHFLLDILKVRLASGGLSDYVAENKRKTSKAGIFQKRRQEVEDQRIEMMKRWAVENGIDPNFASSLMYQIITESCREQDQLMVEKFIKSEKQLNENDSIEVCEYKKQNLLSLTATVANSYNQGYSKGFFGSELLVRFEKKMISSLLADVDEDDRGLALDFGCATGNISFELAKHFKKVIGFDISDAMIAVANDQKENLGVSNIDFVVADIEDGQQMSIKDNSVSLVVMNMGTTSDVHDTVSILNLIKRILKPGGKFFLSFYNSESLLNTIDFVPWPLPLTAYIDNEKHCLEVHYDGKVYFLHAQPRNVDEVKRLLSDFKLENIFTYPTLASIIPDICTKIEGENGTYESNDKVCQMIKIIDRELANSSKASFGTYIIAVGSK